jgi:hypothetical protein
MPIAQEIKRDLPKHILIWEVPLSNPENQGMSDRPNQTATTKEIGLLQTARGSVRQADRFH